MRKISTVLMIQLNGRLMAGLLRELWRFGGYLAYIFEIYAENTTKNKLKVQTYSNIFFSRLVDMII